MTYLPQKLGHVKDGLAHGELKDRPGPLHLVQGALHLREPDPRGAVAQVPLEVLVIQRAAAVELRQRHLQLDVGLIY